jgi:PAS domain S-box-containing protein
LTVEVRCSASEKQKSVFRVLHVDDDVCFLDVSKQVLTMENNFEIDNAKSVDEAFKKMARQMYDAVVSDFEMPQKNGLDFLKELREQNNQIPFILFTGKGREDVAIKALNLGADRYINKQGNPETVYGELSDAIIKTIEHKHSKKMLVESESKYRKLVENSLQGIAIIQGPPPKFVFANAAMKELFGYTTEEIIALSPEQIIRNVHPDDRDVFFERFQKRIEGKEPESTYVFRGFRKDGTLKWVEVCANLIEFNGKPAVQAVFLDITENKKAEESLRENEQRYRELANCLPEIVFETDLNGKLEFANVRAAEISGYCMKEIEKGLNMLQFIIPEDRKRAAESIQRLVSGNNNAPTEYTFLRKDGTTFPALITATPRICKNKITGFRGIVLDISERKKSEKALLENEKRSRAIVANSPIGIATSGVDKKFLTANESFCRIIGYTEEELRKLTFKEITHPEDLNESLIKMKELENGRTSSFTLDKRYIRKEGTVINGKIMISAVRNQNVEPELFVVQLEDITERKKTEERRKVLESKVNQYSKHLKWIVDLRTAQLKDANERLVKNERLAAIGELAGMVGHDLRNPLTGIKNATYFLKKKGATISIDQYEEMLETIDQCIDHSNKIINDLLDYSREMQLELTKYEARNLIENAIGMVQSPERIQIINNIQKETWIWVNPDKMMRVFINLIKNAIDAIPDKGILEIKSKKTRNRVEIAFADTGSGISDETLKKIFTPLFTTKAQGMGFGLAICKRIVEAHGGTITVKTALNKGTTFTISLPIQPKVNLR